MLVRATDTPAPAERVIPYVLPSPQELHLNRELGECYRAKSCQVCIGLQGFSTGEKIQTLSNSHTCELHPTLLILICLSGTEGQLQSCQSKNACNELRGLTRTECHDHFQSPRLISKQTTSDRWLISVVTGDSPQAQTRGIPECIRKLKGSFHVD